VVAAAIAVAGGAIGAAAASPLGRGLTWLAAGDPFMAAVQESVPMLRTGGGGWDVGGALVWMTGFYAIVPALLAGLAWRVAAIDRGRDRGLLLLLVWGSCLFALSLAQRRFGESFAPALAILVAFWLSLGHRRLRAALAGRGFSPRATRAIAASAVALAIAAGLSPYYGPLAGAPERLAALPRALGASDGDVAAATSADVRVQESVERFREVLRARGALPVPGAPTAGVMNTWPLGHKLLRITGLGVATTPFGGYVRPEVFHEWSDFFLAEDEDAAIALLDARGLDWVAVDADLAPIGSAIVGRGENPRAYYGKVPQADGTIAYPAEARLVRTLYFRLTQLAGAEAEIALPSAPPERVPALEHLRLVVDARSDAGPGAVSVFERVAGARLVVRGEPDERGEVAYRFVSDVGRERIYRASFALDAAGRAEVRVPYATAPDGPGSAYEICTARGCTSARASEAEVRSGTAIAVPLPAAGA
jgi:asparagine N-glycosylation enzyme membrane subunit Stt3